MATGLAFPLTAGKNAFQRPEIAVAISKILCISATCPDMGVPAGSGILRGPAADWQRNLAQVRFLSCWHSLNI
jgi:hypothetical protein